MGKILLSLVSCFLVVVLAQEELRVEVLSQPAQCQLKSKNGDRLTMDYTGTLLDGTQFDTSVNKKPFKFTLGAGQVIQGWDQGPTNMCIREKRRLTIPPQLAYGSAGVGGVIPGDATLKFDVELLAINRADVELRRHVSPQFDIRC